MDYCDKIIKFRPPRIINAYYDRAGVFAQMGEKYKAYKDLKMVNQNQAQGLWMMNLIKADPLFDSIRNEPEFQQIIRDVETKYKAEHERVRKWLEK